MHPILINTDSFILPSWHALFLLAALSSYLFATILNRLLERPLTQNQINSLFLATYLGSLLGARMWGVILEEGFYNPFDVISETFKMGPMISLGGMVLGGLGAVWVIKREGLPFGLTADIVAVSGFFGLLLGRIGCFLNGDDYGMVIYQQPPPWWAVTFPANPFLANQPDPLPRIPVQLVEALFGAVIALAGAWILKTSSLKEGDGDLSLQLRTKSREGLVALLCITSYCLFRFFIEFLRDDPRTMLTPHFSLTQLLCLLGVPVGGGVIFKAYRDRDSQIKICQ